MKKLFFLLFFYCVAFSKAQTTSSFTFHSEILKEDRNIRIHLPKSFEVDSLQTYPLILALDGEYLFYSILGVSEVLIMQEMVPESIIVGIDQNYPALDQESIRWLDCDYNYKQGTLSGKGISFKQFIEAELMPYLTKKYRIGKFKTLAGHSLTANYINFFLADSLFKGFIAISPYITTSTENAISQNLESKNTNTYYFLSTGEYDLSRHNSQITRQDSMLFKQISNPNFKYSFKNYPDESHMSLVTRSMPDAISQIYHDFSPLYKLNMDSTIREENDLVSYLIDRYKNIEKVYDLNIPMREYDILSMAWIIEEQEDWIQLKKIGLMEVELFPNSIYGYYMMGLAEEKNNNLQAALDYYQKGYAKLGEDVTNKEDFYKDIERVENMLK